MSLERIFERMRARWRAERARRELHALSDRTLQDIGLKRVDIDALVIAANAPAETDAGGKVKKTGTVLALDH